MKYGRGLKRTHPDRLAHREGLAVFGTPRGSAQLKPCPRLNQGRSSTCHAHSAVGAIWTAQAAQGRTPPWIGSPLTLASCVYADVRSRTTPSSITLSPLTDDGADLQDDVGALYFWGLAPMGPSILGRDGLSDVPDGVPGQPFPEADQQRVELAANDIVTGEYQIVVNSVAPTTCALSLDGGVPIWLGTFVDTAFEDLGANDIAQPPNVNDPDGGGHAMYISGYRTAPDGTYEFRVENSWGTGWADNGAVWASQAWIIACWTLWPMKVA